MYVNTINYGDGCYGIQAAAKHYYGKNASELNLTEAALLSGIPQNPTYNNPVYYYDNAKKRRNAVLNRMYVNGYITQEEYEGAIETDLGLDVQPRSVDGLYRAHFFSAYARNQLEDMYTTSGVFNNGLVVVTTLDWKMQKLAEQVCKEKETTLDSDVEVSLTCVDPNTGFIKAARGGKNFYKDQWSTSTDMHRQAGSTFKVFALVSCLEQGFSPQSAVSGAGPFELNGWKPQNYGGMRFGMMTLASATWQSSNIAYARIVRTIGPDAIAETATRMGITSQLVPVNSIVLGTAEVNTLEMASAYGTLAAGG